MLLKAWRGEERLWKVWWLIGLPVRFVEQYLSRRVHTFDPTPAEMAVIALFVVIGIVWAYCAWRCSPNVSHPFWKFVARILIVFVIVQIFVVLLG